jgi:hypothetical protein
MYYLSFDPVAENGRAILAHFQSNPLFIRKIHQFFIEPVLCHGNLCWGILALLFEKKL